MFFYSAQHFFVLVVAVAACPPRTYIFPKNTHPTKELIRAVEARAKALGGEADFRYEFATGAPRWTFDMGRTRVSAKDLKSLFDKMCPNTIYSVSIQKTDLSDEILDVLDACRPIYFKLGGDDFAAIGTGLFSFDASFSKLTSKGVNRALRTHNRLNWINVSGLLIEPSAFANIRESDLSVLLMNHALITPPVAKDISRLPLQILSLRGSSADDAFVLALSSIHDNNLSRKNLEELDLSFTRITDKSLINVAMFPELRKLNLSSTMVSDSKTIAKMVSWLKHLEVLDLSGIQISAGEVTSLRNAWPEIRFKR